jgi:hypothetical protein
MRTSALILPLLAWQLLTLPALATDDDDMKPTAARKPYHPVKYVCTFDAQPEKKQILHPSRLPGPWWIGFEECIRRAGYDTHEEVFRDKHVLCMCMLQQDGHINNLKVVKSSGSEEADRSALILIEKASNSRGSFRQIIDQTPILVDLDYPNIKVTSQLAMDP